jgi:hypothetical protein
MGGWKVIGIPITGKRWSDDSETNMGTKIKYIPNYVTRN